MPQLSLNSLSTLQLFARDEDASPAGSPCESMSNSREDIAATDTCDPEGCVRNMNLDQDLENSLSRKLSLAKRRMFVALSLSSSCFHLPVQPFPVLIHTEHDTEHERVHPACCLYLPCSEKIYSWIWTLNLTLLTASYYSLALSTSTATFFSDSDFSVGLRVIAGFVFVCILLRPHPYFSLKMGFFFSIQVVFLLPLPCLWSLYR